MASARVAAMPAMISVSSVSRPTGPSRAFTGSQEAQVDPVAQIPAVLAGPGALAGQPGLRRQFPADPEGLEYRAGRENRVAQPRWAH